jgi:D-glycero-D-manno-heptose 1,7-bisphosphate phosphatase
VTKGVFLDRDGVINRKPPEGDYVTRWEDFQILPGVIEGIAQLNRAGFRVIVVTNQRCIAKGLIAAAELEVMHERLLHFLGQAGATINAIYYCPHEMEPVCQCRKPAPGMLLEAAREHGIDLGASWMIGDSESDIKAGKNAGCKTARLCAANENVRESEPGTAPFASADIFAPSLLSAVGQILQWGNAAADSFAAASTGNRIFQSTRVETKRDL